ncbi:MAG: hypothetical protein IKW97_10235 [Muribaculaceae bacterium]|nr:hypothetical protein [Muribaculaceae bacterium]
MVKKLLVFSFLLILSVVSLKAQRVQVVDTDGLPIAAVCVTNEKGALVGSTDHDGWLEDAKGVKHLFFSHVAFKPKDVNIDTIPSRCVVMQDENFQLAELEVKPKELLYVQTYYRCIYVCDEGPIYFRAGVVDNTYELAKKKISSKTRSVSRGMNGFMRFVLSTLVGHYIDEWARIDTATYYSRILKHVDKGNLFITEGPSGRRLVSDTISVLGYIDEDLQAGQRITNFDKWTYKDHLEATEAAAKEAKTGKKQKQKKEKYSDENNSNYEVYNIDENGNSRIDDLVMRQILASGHFKRTDQDYIILLETYTIGRDYIDKKEFKQTRKENEVEMDINELRQLEQNHHIPPLAPNLKAAVDELFKKELND